MADPTLSNPWDPPPPPETSPSNQWTFPPAVNSYDPQALLAQLNRECAAAIKDAFGRDISLTDLLDLLYRFKTNKLNDNELVGVIEMGIYFARNRMHWNLASDNLEHWLVAGLDATPEVVMDHKLIMNLDLIVQRLCDKHYEEIVEGVNSRLSASAGTKFPKSETMLTGPSGEQIVVRPAVSPLRIGGEETLYKSASTLTIENHLQQR